MTSPDAPAAAITDPLVLNRERVAALLDVPLDTIANLHRTGQLPAFKVGKHLRWHLSDLNEFIERVRQARNGNTP